jgi:hypothetical protein
MRRRLSALVASFGDVIGGLGDEVKRELGVEVPFTGFYNWDRFLERAELRDVLDFITVCARFFKNYSFPPGRGELFRTRWLTEVARIFREEEVQYSVDDRGGVHFLIDSEFERSRASTIAALSNARYANVNAEYSRVESALGMVPPNGKDAIRSTFTAAEGLFRLIFPQAPRLTGSEVSKHLQPMVQRVYANDRTALGSASKILSSFQAWVDAAHFYRHEAGTEDVAQPPIGLAILLVSQGAAAIRWLAELDCLES